MLDLLITILHVSVAVFMILIVLVQGGNSGGIGAALGGGNSSGVFGAGGATSILGKMTYVAAILFMVTSLTLTVRTNHRGKTGLLEKATQTMPAAATTPPGGEVSEENPAVVESSDSIAGESQAPDESAPQTEKPAAN